MRTVGSVGEATEKRIYDAAAELIAAHGYEGVNLRQIASQVGIQVGSLYNHIKSKQDLLYNILHNVLTELLGAIDRDVKTVAPPDRRLEAFVKLHITYHTSRIPAVLIATTELRSLTPENYKKIVRLRVEYDHCLRDILRDGCRDAVFDIENLRLTEYAIIGMLTGVCVWYNPRGLLSQTKLIEHYQDLVFRLAGAKRQQAIQAKPAARAVKAARSAALT